LNDITTAAYSGQLDLSRFVTVGLNDVRIGDQIANVRLEDVLSELAKLKTIIGAIQGKTAGARAGKRQPIRQDHDGSALSALRGVSARRRHGRSRDRQLSLGVTPTILPDGVRVEAQVLWGSIGWATPAAFGVALAGRGSAPF
jgi:indolepyruvate decarboxylase